YFNIWHAVFKQFTIMDGTLPALAYRVVHVLWQPDHNGGDIILLCYFHHFINAEMTIFRINFQSLQTLGCPSQCITESNPYCIGDIIQAVRPCHLSYDLYSYMPVP